MDQLARFDPSGSFAELSVQQTRSVTLDDGPGTFNFAGPRQLDLPLLPLSPRESQFAGDLLRLAANTHLVVLDSVSVASNRSAWTFYGQTIQYHHIVMMGLQIPLRERLQRIE